MLSSFIDVRTLFKLGILGGGESAIHRPDSRKYFIKGISARSTTRCIQADIHVDMRKQSTENEENV